MTNQEQAAEPRIPAGADAARSRYVQVPAGQVVLLLAPTEWAAVDHAVDQQVGRMSGSRTQLRALETAARKVQAAREQLQPPQNGGPS